MIRAGVIAIAIMLVATGAVAAKTRTAVTMDVPTTFDAVPDVFSASGIPGCSGGIVSDGGAHVEFTPRQGIFAGYKVFECAGSESGFVVRLNARFGDASVGAWAIVAAWGELAGLRGSGALTGESIDNGIFDHYVGTRTS
jgi:hypothetical protein